MWDVWTVQSILCALCFRFHFHLLLQMQSQDDTQWNWISCKLLDVLAMLLHSVSRSPAGIRGRPYSSSERDVLKTMAAFFCGFEGGTRAELGLGSVDSPLETAEHQCTGDVVHGNRFPFQALKLIYFLKRGKTTKTSTDIQRENVNVFRSIRLGCLSFSARSARLCFSAWRIALTLQLPFVPKNQFHFW